MSWKEGKLVTVTRHSLSGNLFKLQYGNKFQDITLATGQTVKLDRTLTPQ